MNRLGLGDISEILDKLARGLPNMVQEAGVDTRQDYARKNIEQLADGKYSDGTDIKPDYAPPTARKKGRKTPNLKESGDFYNSILSDSTLDYEQYIVKRYGAKIFGLTEENKRAYAQGPFWGVLQNKITALTGLGFK